MSDSARRFIAGAAKSLLIAPVLLILLLACWLPVRAESHTMDEQTFWQSMATTNSQLKQAIASPDARPAAIQKIQSTWGSINAVQLSDGKTMSLDLHWLLDDLSSADTAGLQTLQYRVQSMLDAHNAPNPAPTDLMPALQKVLQDPRFHYQDTQVPNISLPDLGPIGEFAITLFALAVILMGIIYFGRRLQIQSAVKREPISLDADPDTSAQAQEKADTSEAIHDYRNAIRYLYLYSLLLLNERGLIHYDRTLTNREHLRQIRNKRQLTDLLRPVVDTFDNVWYGFTPVDETMYRAFRQNVEQLAHYQTHES